MKKVLSFLLSAFVLAASFFSCSAPETPALQNSDDSPAGDTSSFGGSDIAFGVALEELGAYGGRFEGDVRDVEVTCISGTPGCYTVQGDVLRFFGVQEDSVYAVSGKFCGNVVIDVSEEYKFDLELCGFSLISKTVSPVTVLSGDEISVTAKKDTVNYIYDDRETVDTQDESVSASAVFSEADLELCGKGMLFVVSANNNGVHTKDDLQVKNLTLLVACADNALKGNDGVELESGETTLISTKGDGIKTKNSDVSQKGKQRGTVSVLGGKHTVYAACDGIDAAYDVVVQGESELSVYTDKYSNYSSEVTAAPKDVYYIRFTSEAYKYSVKYYNSDEDFRFVDAEYHSTVSGGRTNYVYYVFPRLDGYSKMQFFVYSAEMPLSQDSQYLVSSDYLTPNENCDTFALVNRGNSVSYQWTNYSKTVREEGPGGMGGPGSMGEGNTEKGEYSTKGIKAANEILISSGNVSIKSYDDALHANAAQTLVNGQTPKGNVTISDGVVSLYSNDDGIHADGAVSVSGGLVTVSYSYEGVEGNTVSFSGGRVAVAARDDGVNSKAVNGIGIEISGGELFVSCAGDGLDTNTRTKEQGIVFAGGKTAVFSNSAMNSALDTEQGYTYHGGQVLCVMPSRAMTMEVVQCSVFDAVASQKALSLKKDDFLCVNVEGELVAALSVPEGLSALAVYLGSSKAEIYTSKTLLQTTDSNGVYFK